MVSSIASVVWGYLAMAVIVMAGTALVAALMLPGGIAGARKMEGHPPRNYLYSNLALSFAAGLCGGWITARRAPQNPMRHSALLAIFLLAMSALSARTQASRQPRWYPVTIAVIGVLGVLLGGVLETASSVIS